MKIRKVHVVCFSPTQTTLSVLEAIASAFPVETIVHDATLMLGIIQLPEFTEQDLVLVGAPVYGGRVPRNAEAFYQSVRGKGSPAVVVAVYGNCNIGDALVEMDEYCSAGGCRVVAGAAFIGEHSFSPTIANRRPNPEDLQLAKDFGRLVAAKLSADHFDSVELPGTRPLKVRNPVAPSAWAPGTTEDCIQCGICVENCPVQIIDAKNAKHILEPEKCLRCGSCVKKCPVSAKYFTGEAFERSMKYLTSSCSEDKKPQLFL
jgi:ferredoxin